MATYSLGRAAGTHTNKSVRGVGDETRLNPWGRVDGSGAVVTDRGRHQGGDAFCDCFQHPLAWTPSCATAPRASLLGDMAPPGWSDRCARRHGLLGKFGHRIAASAPDPNVVVEF